MEALNKAMNFVCDNWVAICTIIVIALAVAYKVKDFLGKSKEEQEAIFKEQVEIAKAQIKERMLRWVMEAELDYQEWLKSGAVKRAQVIDRVFEAYPILSKVTNQEEVISWIDKTIEDALVKLRELLEANDNKKVAGKYARKLDQASESEGG